MASSRQNDAPWKIHRRNIWQKAVSRNAARHVTRNGKIPLLMRYAASIPAPKPSQMSREIDWFLRQNKPKPKVFIACDRQAYVASDDPDLRITFDHNMRWRETELDLRAGSHGEPLAADGMVLLEIKAPGAVPLWLAHILGELDVFPTGFSKYGVCYRDNILEKYINGVITCV